MLTTGDRPARPGQLRTVNAPETKAGVTYDYEVKSSYSVTSSGQGVEATDTLRSTPPPTLA